MAARIYVKHLKLEWVLNDIDLVYLQKVHIFDTLQIPMKPLKFRLPPKEK